MSESDIDKGVPIPAAGNRRRHNFSSMAIGDSLFFDTREKMESAASSARGYAKRNNPGFKVTSRKVEGGYRLWRIK